MSVSRKSWHVADNRHYRALFGLQPAIVGKEVISRIHAVNHPELQRLREQIFMKGYSENTLRTYTLELAQLLYILQSHPAD